jgi:hypothetical protein
MQRRLAAVFAATVMVSALGMGAEDLRAHAQQADSLGTSATAEGFDSAKTYFDRARKLGFPATGIGPPYILRAEFKTRGSSGTLQTGTYTDTWVSDRQWRREAVLGSSRFVRSRNGKKWYRLDEGPDAALLQFVLTAMEPIPTTDTLQESSWKIKHDVVDGAPTVRVARGKANDDGTIDANESEAYWFDETGQLVATRLNELQTRRSKFEDFNGMRVARRVETLVDGKVGMRIDVTALGPAGVVDSHMFVIKKHDWRRQFAGEAR